LPDPDLDVVVVQLAVDRTHVLAEVTRDAVDRLRIVEGARLQVLIKSVSPEVRASTLEGSRSED
jgi:ABC-type molybdate transport system ATPase subunit